MHSEGYEQVLARWPPLHQADRIRGPVPCRVEVEREQRRARRHPTVELHNRAEPDIDKGRRMIRRPILTKTGVIQGLCSFPPTIEYEHIDVHHRPMSHRIIETLRQ